MTLIIVPVEILKEGDLVDLDSCPYLSEHPSAQFEYAQIVDVALESPECVAITYEGIDQVGYPSGTFLKVVKGKGRRCNEPLWSNGEHVASCYVPYGVEHDHD